MKTLNKILLLIAMSITSLLSADYSGQGELSLHSWSSEKEIVEGNLKYKWKLWTLVGEPVDELVAQWNIQSVDFHNESDEVKKMLKHPEYASLKYKVCEGSENSGCIPKDIMKKTRIVELKLIGYSEFIHGNRNSAYSYVFDAGVMSKPYASHITVLEDKYGKWSYSTPGSKSWDNCFEDKTENESKEIMKSGVKLSDFRIHKIKFDFTEVKRYIIQRNKDYYEAEKYTVFVAKQRDGDDSMDWMLQEIEENLKQYDPADSYLKNESDKKSQLLQATKKRADKRHLPTETQKGVWVDKETGLMWQDTDIKRISWPSAKRYCKNLTLAGYSDWYLPSKQQLFSLMRGNQNKKNKLKVIGEPYEEFWSSITTISHGSEYAITVSFDSYSGEDRGSTKYGANPTRCVRKNE